MPTTPGTYFCTPYLLGIQAVESFQCLQDGYNCYMYFDMYGNYNYCGTQYCASGYLLYTEYPANSPVYYYRSNGIGSYYTTSYCAAGAFYCFYYPDICIVELNNSYPNGCIYIEHDGSGGYRTGLYEYCNNGYLFDYEDSLNYSCGYFSDGTGYYYIGIFNYCSSGTCFCSSDYYLQLPPSGCPYYFGSYDVIADGSGNRFNCYNFSPQNQLIKTDYLSGCCINYLSDGTGYYLTCTIFCSGTILDCSGLYVNINNQLIDNGSRCLISDGTGSCFSIINYCQYNHEFLSSGTRSYMSDSSGSYFIYRNAKLNFVNINWDFSQESKNKYFDFFEISGDTLPISLNNSKNFYDITTFENSTFRIDEADNCCSINLYNVKYPFIFLKNSGPCSLYVIASSGDYFNNFQTGKNTLIENHSGINYELNSGESLFLHINTNLDGSKYLSKSCYAFGFYYSFSNVSCYNESGEFPACCDNSNLPLYIYECIFDYPLNNCSDNYLNEIRSFGFLNYVDDGVDLNIKLYKNAYSGDTLFCSNSICKNYLFCTNHGLDFYKSNIQINNLDIQINGERLCCVTEIDNLNILNRKVDADLSINIIYDIDLSTSYDYNYMYCYSGDLNSSIHKIYSGSQAIQFSGSECLISDFLYCYNSDSNDQYICVEPCDFYSVKSICTNSVCRDNIFMPVKSEFNQNYFCKMRKSSFLPIIETGILTGYWSCELSENYSYFINSINLISCEDQKFIDFKPEIYSLNLNYSDSRFCSDCVVQYSFNNAGDEFDLIFENSEREFIYSGITFKYNPAICIYYMGNFYEIPDSCIEYTGSLSGNQSVFNFPLRAVSKDKLKITTSFENFELVNFACAYIDYNDFTFCLQCSDSNYINFNIPKINSGSGDFCSLESPSIEINLNKVDILQKNLNLYINPLNSTSCDTIYGLNDFILFLKSELTSGLVHSENYSSFTYGDSDYNFLFLDLKSEINNKKIGSPTGEWFLFDSKKTFENNSANSFFPIKSRTGNGYNYITYVVTGFCYSDSFVDYSGNNQVNLSGDANLINTDFSSNYYAGSYFTGLESGSSGAAITGCLCNSIFSYDNNRVYISYTKDTIGSTSSGRDIYFEKKSTYSGIQPVLIQTNYPLLDIKYPMVCSNLKLYSTNVDNENINEIFYYVYNLNNFYQTNLKFLSPEGTAINTICWVDFDLDNNIACYLDQDFSKGNINKNAASISANINPNNNNYTYDETKNYSFCINIIGDI